MTARPVSGGAVRALSSGIKKKRSITSAAILPFQCGANARHMISAKEIKRSFPGEAQKIRTVYGALAIMTVSGQNYEIMAG